jgi:hypothetical protein
MITGSLSFSRPVSAMTFDGVATTRKTLENTKIGVSFIPGWHGKMFVLTDIRRHLARKGTSVGSVMDTITALKWLIVPKLGDARL